jgi:glutamine amidotransferase PdxT
VKPTVYHPAAGMDRGRRKSDRMKIGVLALQGDFDAHRKRLEELGVEVVLVKHSEQLDGIDGLVIPGGESSTFLQLLGDGGLERLSSEAHVRDLRGCDPAGE